MHHIQNDLIWSLMRYASSEHCKSRIPSIGTSRWRLGFAYHRPSLSIVIAFSTRFHLHLMTYIRTITDGQVCSSVSRGGLFVSLSPFTVHHTDVPVLVAWPTGLYAKNGGKLILKDVNMQTAIISHSAHWQTLKLVVNRGRWSQFGLRQRRSECWAFLLPPRNGSWRRLGARPP